MSEKTKTPRELAREKYPQDIATTDEAYMYSYNDLQEERQEAYLAGLKSGALLRHEQGYNVVIFEDWWASLEKKDE